MLGETRTRREQYSEATKAALVDSAIELFKGQGYRATSLDDIAERARVTKGAIYHHFASKEDLFEAAMDELEAASIARMSAAAAASSSAWEGAISALDSFLDDVVGSSAQRVCFVEGPGALGYERWWACGERYYVGMIRQLLERMAAEGLLVDGDIDVMARLIFGLVTSGVFQLLHSDNPKEQMPQMRDMLVKMMIGLLTQAPV